MYVPEFKGPIEGYVVNSLTKNMWRVMRNHTREDMMQEAYIVFMRCAGKYPIIDTPQHFMALFKRAWTNHITDLSVKESAHKATFADQPPPRDEDFLPAEPVGDLDNMGYLSLMVEQAPREVLMVLNLFLNAPQELLELATKAWATQGRRKPDGNAMLNRMLGLPADADPIGKVHDHFRN